jgi:hypothetical protein
VEKSTGGFVLSAPQPLPRKENDSTGNLEARKNRPKPRGRGRLLFVGRLVYSAFSITKLLKKPRWVAPPPVIGLIAHS